MVPNGWERHLVGKICSSIVPGRNKPKSFGGDIAWVTVPEIKSRYIPSNIQENYVSEDVINECGGKIVPEGAVVMSAVGDLGLVAITKEQVVLNQQLHAFVCSTKIDNEYLAYWLVTQKPLMESIASRTTILYLNKSNCESIPVLVPPLPEQQKIAKILTSWDKAIDTTERLIDNSKQQKKALMQQLLTGKKRLLDGNGKRFEGEWEEYKLKDVAKIIVSPVDKKTVEGEIPVELCNYTDVYYNIRITKSLDFMKATAKQSEIDRFTLQVDDVIITKDSETPEDIAVPALVSEDLNGVVCGYHLAIIRPNKDKVIGAFLNYLFATPKIGYYFFSLANGATRFGLTISSIEQAQFKLPSLAEQQKISAVLTNADKEIELLEQQLADLQQEKKALMQVLLTGKKRVRVD